MKRRALLAILFLALLVLAVGGWSADAVRFALTGGGRLAAAGRPAPV